MSIIAGVDEAGVGSLMGMMAAGAVVLPESFDVSGLCDSKKLTHHKRRTLYETITQNAHFGIGVVTNEEIDTLGMAKCRRLVFHRALDNLQTHFDKIIVDGTLFEPYKNVHHECIVKADATVPCVSAASIVAKHYRDTSILEYCEQHKDDAARYDWVNNKGYPAPKHLAAIKEYGIVSYHRQSFGPCKLKLAM